MGPQGATGPAGPGPQFRRGNLDAFDDTGKAIAINKETLGDPSDDVFFFGNSYYPIRFTATGREYSAMVQVTFSIQALSTAEGQPCPTDGCVLMDGLFAPCFKDVTACTAGQPCDVTPYWRDSHYFKLPTTGTAGTFRYPLSASEAWSIRDGQTVEFGLCLLHNGATDFRLDSDPVITILLAPKQ